MGKGKLDVGTGTVTLFDKVLVEQTAQDGCRYVPIGQKDASQHCQLVTLRLSKTFQEEQQLQGRRGENPSVTKQPPTLEFPQAKMYIIHQCCYVGQPKVKYCFNEDY